MDGYVSLAVFYKDLVNWTRDGGSLINFRNDETSGGADYFIPGFHDRMVPTRWRVWSVQTCFYSAGDLVTPPDYGYFSFFEDGLKGKVKGLEFTGQRTSEHVA